MPVCPGSRPTQGPLHTDLLSFNPSLKKSYEEDIFAGYGQCIDHGYDGLCDGEPKRPFQEQEQDGGLPKLPGKGLHAGL
jgi:hypothetical protein